MKNATATSHGSTWRMAGDGVAVVRASFRASVAKLSLSAPMTVGVLAWLLQPNGSLPG